MEKNPHAVALGRLGGLRGGASRAASLSPSERTAIARRAANFRWSVDLRRERVHDDRPFRRRVANRLARGTELDPGDLEHVLFNLTLTPTERLRWGFPQRFAGSPVTKDEISRLRSLSESGFRFMIVGMAAAILQGSNCGTNDINLWFNSSSDWTVPSVGRVVRHVGRLDGLSDFESEYAGAIDCTIEDFCVKLLPLDRIITCKMAVGRLKDNAVIPDLRAALMASSYLNWTRRGACPPP
jgi:hypothetical protein